MSKKDSKKGLGKVSMSFEQRMYWEKVLNRHDRLLTDAEKKRGRRFTPEEAMDYENRLTENAMRATYGLQPQGVENAKKPEPIAKKPRWWHKFGGRKRPP